MKNKVLIKIIGTQTDETGEAQTIELITEGMLYTRDGSYYLVYRETALSGLDDTTTSLKIEPGCVTLVRSGSVSSRQVFRVGHKHHSRYQTPYGTFTVGVIPHQVESAFNREGGWLKLGYALELDGKAVSTNQLSVTAGGI